MMRLRKYVFPLLLCFVLLVTFGSKGYDCVSDDITLERIESQDHLKMLSGVISILGEGACFHKKLPVFGQKDFPFMGACMFEAPFNPSFNVRLESRLAFFDYALFHVYRTDIFILISSLRL